MAGLNYETAGNPDGPALLLVHGFLSSNALRTDEQAVLNSRAQLDGSQARLTDVTNELRLAELALERVTISANASAQDTSQG